jgi:hypothetical protein
MINKRISAVLITRDAVTGRAPSHEITAELDGEPFRPEYRDGGYIIFIDLPEREYKLKLKSVSYFDETLTLLIDGDRDGHIVSLKPKSARTVTRGGFDPGAAVSVAFPRAPEIKTAQIIEPGERERVRVFCRSSAALPVLPGEFLLADGDNSERCVLRELSGGAGDFAAPFERRHERGLPFLPCALYRADDGGRVTASIGSGDAYLFDEAAGRLFIQSE